MTTKRWVLILFVLALVPRLLVAVIFGNTVLFPDELQYTETANHLLLGDGSLREMSYTSPAYPLFLILFSTPLPDNLVFLRIVQATVAAIGSVLIFQLGRLTFGFWPAVAASVIYSFDPLLVAASAMIYPEGLTGVLLLAVLIFAIDARKRKNRWSR